MRKGKEEKIKKKKKGRPITGNDISVPKQIYKQADAAMQSPMDKGCSFGVAGSVQDLRRRTVGVLGYLSRSAARPHYNLSTLVDGLLAPGFPNPSLICTTKRTCRTMPLRSTLRPRHTGIPVKQDGAGVGGQAYLTDPEGGWDAPSQPH